MTQFERPLESGMYAPLLWKGEPLGVICVDNCERPLEFSDEDLRLMVAVGQDAAMAVGQDRLQQELKRSTSLLGGVLTNFSPKVRERILARARHGRLRLGGERSEVTILFADIRGFTKMTASMDPEDVADMLNEYFAALVHTIFEHDGTVDKFVGDAPPSAASSPTPSSTSARCGRRSPCKPP